MKRFLMLLIALAALGGLVMIVRGRRASEGQWAEGDWASAYGRDPGLSVAAGDIRATADTSS
jgi:hypothetical protein